MAKIKASFFSNLFHCWLSHLVTRSHQRGTLHLDDLYDIPEDLDSIRLTDRLETSWKNEIKRCPENPSLIRATLRTAGWKLLFVGFLLVPFEVLNIIQPLLVIRLIQFFEPCSKMSSLGAWILATGIILTLVSMNFIFHQYVYRIHMFAMQMRVAYSGLIFRKVLRLSSHSMSNTSSGQITNLLANDSPKVEVVHYCFNYLWVAPLQITAVIIILWYYVNYIAFVAIGYTLLLLLIQPLLGRIFLRLRAEILKMTDKRIKIMSEMIKSMRVVKMYCWESAFEKKIRRIRKSEVVNNARYMMCTSVETVLSHSYINIIFLIVYGMMWTFGMKFDTGLFTLLYVLLNYTRQCCISFFNMAIRDVFNYVTAQNRIQTFLLLDESERDHRLYFTESKDNVSIISRTPKVICQIKQAQWKKNENFSLSDISFDAHPGDLICIIGSVGCGKSSLLQTLIGEITYFQGKIRLAGSVCYVPQESWIFSSTVKNNILFGKDYNHSLFQRIIRATALDADLIHLSHGINTLVGDQGVMLSGGQKARINLARALYRDADIYFLDDPLSAVDARVAKHLFEKSMKEYLHRKICILVTHQIQFLRSATKIIVLDQGQVIQIGTYDDLLNTSSSIVNQLTIEDVDQSELHQESSNDSNDLEVDIDVEEEISLLPKNIEQKREGTVGWNVYLSFLQASSGVIFGILLLLTAFGLHQATSIYSHWWLAAWSNEESLRSQNGTSCMHQQSNQTGLIYHMNDDVWNRHRNQRFYLFSVLVALLVCLTFFRTVICRLLCLNAARILHNKMFQRLIRCPILFFDTNPAGRILNRFTSDIAAMDDSLPITVFEFLGCLAQVLGTIIIVSFINPWSFIPALISSMGMLYLRSRLAPCSRDLKRLVGTTRSPVYSQVTSTVNGLQLIRSYGAEHVSLQEFHHHLDNNTRVTFLIATLNRWSAMRFDWISLCFIGLVIISAIVVRMYQYQLSSVEMALTLTYSITLMGIFQYTIRQSVEVETQMTSVERILEYCQLDQESSSSERSVANQPPIHWPYHGHIVFENVSMSHGSDHSSPLVLRNISCIIESREKIGIVGRTGAGKSSLIQTLFRMGTVVHGHIIIDGINIETIELEDLRSRISMIPQDPILFTGTIRNNLDPFGVYSDTEIWHALDQVQLKSYVKDRMADGLHSNIDEGGSNLSVGQKQLVCLARAILRKTKILVIDEATANVDQETDDLIQQAIRHKFRECTVLTVAHRLRTIIDSDRILVLDEGVIVEFDSAQSLLSTPNTHFAGLVAQTEPTEAEYLRTLAHCSDK